MPASWAKAFSPTIALLGCTCTPVMWESRREVLKISSVRTRVSTAKKSRRGWSAITISSREALPARSPIPMTAHSTWRAHPDRGHRVRHRLPQVVVTVHRDDRFGAVPDPLTDARHALGPLLRNRVADGVRDVDGAGPASITASSTSHMYSKSEREASSGENSTSPQ